MNEQTQTPNQNGENTILWDDVNTKDDFVEILASGNVAELRQPAKIRVNQLLRRGAMNADDAKEIYEHLEGVKVSTSVKAAGPLHRTVTMNDYGKVCFQPPREAGYPPGKKGEDGTLHGGMDFSVPQLQYTLSKKDEEGNLVLIDADELPEGSIVRELRVGLDKFLADNPGWKSVAELGKYTFQQRRAAYAQKAAAATK